MSTLRFLCLSAILLFVVWLQAMQLEVQSALALEIKAAILLNDSTRITTCLSQPNDTLVCVTTQPDLREILELPPITLTPESEEPEVVL